MPRDCICLAFARHIAFCRVADPDGYSILKMNEQLRDEGYASFEEKFIAENGQEAWDKRQADAEAEKAAKGQNSLIIVGVLFTAFAVAQNAGIF